MKIGKLIFIFSISSVVLFSSCKDEDDTPGSILGGPNQDLELGMQVRDEIESDPAQFPIMPEVTDAQKNAYNYLRNNILAPITNASDVVLDDEYDFPYEDIKIIADTNTLNAFATPGGFIYVYAGLIRFLEVEDHLAGVLGHEIAHAERRHSIKQIEKQYGLSIILSILAGEESSQLTQIAGQIAGSLAGLAFSRDAESEADEFAVKYNSETPYSCDGVAGFFQKLEELGSGSPPEFLSTHPNPDTRIEEIDQVANDLNCDRTQNAQADYAQFQQWVLEGL